MATDRINGVVEDDTLKAEPVEETGKGTNDGVSFNGTEKLDWQPIPFQSFGKTTRINSADLAREIYKELSLTFHEVKGCNIIAAPNNQFITEVYFERNTEPLPENKIMSLESLIEPVGAGANNNLYYKQRVLQNRHDGKAYTLNEETRILLSDLMFGGRNAMKPTDKKWDNEAYVREIHIPANDPFAYRGRNIERILLRVTGFDLRKILQKLYGRDMVVKTATTDDKDVNFRSLAYYEPRFIKAKPDGTFIMNIEQFDKAAVEEIVMKENPMPQFNIGVQMYS